MRIRSGESQAAQPTPEDARRSNAERTSMYYLGLTHPSAPLSVRERIRIDSRDTESLLDRLAAVGGGRLILSTCERFEAYAVTNAAGLERCTRILGRFLGVDIEAFAAYARIKRGAAAANHLLRVAAGLESRVPGEPQVLGQVRAAYALAMASGSLDPILAAAGRAAIHTGRCVRRETALNGGGRSIASIAVHHAMRACAGRWPPNLVVVGSGGLGGDVVAEIACERFGRIIVAARNRRRAQALADRVGGRACGLDRLRATLFTADAVIVCTAASSYLIDAAAVDVHRDRPLSVIDLSVPRNVDPRIVQAGAVTLRHLDELLADRPGGRAEEVVAAERIVRRELARFTRWRRARCVAPTIAALARRCSQSPDGRTRQAKRRLHRRISELKDSVAA